MKPGFAALLFALAMTMAGRADVPQKAPLTRYQKLWTESPFTARPVDVGGPVYNPLEDYVLLGVSDIGEGRVQVTMMNKKMPTAGRIYLQTGKTHDGMSIKDVIRKPGERLATVVRVERAGQIGEVAFEEKFLKVVSTAPAKPHQDANPHAQGGQPANAEAQAPPIAPAAPRPKFVQGTTPAPPPQGQGGGSGQGPGRFPRRTR